MGLAFSESTVEDAALAWLAELGWAVKHGPDVSPDGDTLTRPSASLSHWERERGRGGKAWERESYSEVVLLERFRNALRPKLMSGEIRTTQLSAT
jgi:type I restriction enzyme R subunit